MEFHNIRLPLVEQILENQAGKSLDHCSRRVTLPLPPVAVGVVEPARHHLGDRDHGVVLDLGDVGGLVGELPGAAEGFGPVAAPPELGGLTG